MGYCIQLIDSDFKIKKENEENVIKLIKNYAESKRKIKWVSKENLKRSKTLLEIFSEIRFELDIDCNGDFVLDYFSGEKQGDEDEIFQAIAKYIEPNSYIEFEGEDGDVFRFSFSKGEYEYIFIENKFDE